ncbi:MAG: hypothetical protein CM15mV14_0820 [uncultured marine virus]|nr:MAG: hypothetical protein CM15mV14_0820 [uncultured marine virus]
MDETTALHVVDKVDIVGPAHMKPMVNNSGVSGRELK